MESENQPPSRPLIRLEDLSDGDIAAIRLLLKGFSAIEWNRLDFRNHDEVYRFLRVNEFDPQSEEDMERLKQLRREAVRYLTETLSIAIPTEIAEVVPTRDLFLIASGDSTRQQWACVVLKVMHIVHHLAGRELAVRLPISDDAVFRAVELKVIQFVEELRAAGYPIAEFEWSRKRRDALITKLLAKRSTLAAQIYDKLRFRLIVKSEQDLVQMLAVLTRKLVPFNYIVPEASVNGLLPVEEITTKTAASPPSPPVPSQSQLVNEFSGQNYRIINFVADLPIRIDTIVPPEQLPKDYGSTVFVLTEFQIADKQTAINNELGECNHEAYKNRQYKKVRHRLLGDQE